MRAAGWKFSEKIRRACLCLLIGLFIHVCPAAYAEKAYSPLTLIREVEVDFSPARVFFLVAPPDGELLRRVPGIFEPFVSQEGEPTRYLLAASVIVPEQSNPLPFAVVVVGNDEQLSYFPPEERQEDEAPEKLWDIQKLREELAAIRLDIGQMKNKRQHQQEQIQRLRNDATVIARVERVDALRARLEQLELRIEGIDNDISHLKKFLELTRSQSQPRNYARRERELIRQLKLLAEASQNAESGERARREMAQDTMQEQLRLIESSRALSETGLRDRLAEVRQRRIALEKKYGQTQIEMERPEEYLQ